MTPLAEVLSPADRIHVRNILNSSITSTAQAETLSRAAVFLREQTFLAEDILEDFRAQEEVERSRLLSELIWRVTCFLDGSETATLGEDRWRLSSRFAAERSLREGREIFTLVRV